MRLPHNNYGANTFRHDTAFRHFNRSIQTQIQTSQIQPTLEELWDVYNSNKDGDSANVIDKNEATRNLGTIYFIEEGMTKEEFISKNSAIYESFNNTMNFTPNSENLHSTVGRVVKDMIANGEFETKKDVILGKFTYMDESTQLLVLEKLTPEEQKEALSKLSDEKQDLLRTQLDTIKQMEKENQEANEPEPPGFAE